MKIDGEIIEKGTLIQSSEDRFTDEKKETDTVHINKKGMKHNKPIIKSRPRQHRRLRI